jgi:hypothetical protein
MKDEIARLEELGKARHRAPQSRKIDHVSPATLATVTDIRRPRLLQRSGLSPSAPG